MLLLREIENRGGGTNSPGGLSEYKPARKRINHLIPMVDETVQKRDGNNARIGVVISRFV